MEHFPKQKSTFILPQMSLEVSTVYAGEQTNATVIICHPHPLHGGSMTNKVVSTLARAFQARGYHTVCFNFRGVGNSAGQFAEGKGELEDVLAIFDWVKQVRPIDSVSLAGFSFGAGMALQASQQIFAYQAQRVGAVDLVQMHHPCLVTVAPPVGQPYFTDIPSIQCPWLCVLAGQDEIISPQQQVDWLSSLAHPPRTLEMAEAGHFFHGKLVPLRDQVAQWLTSLEDGSRARGII